MSRSPRDRYLTVYGRMPVLEALADPSVSVAKVFLALNAEGTSATEILAAAKRHGVVVERVKPEMVSALAHNGRQHQGVAADVRAPNLSSLTDFLARRRGREYRTSLLLTDAIHNPANLGMMIRSATAAGIDGIVVPQRGTAELGPLVIKASAGVAFRAPILRCADSAQAVSELLDARFEILGLDADAPDAADLFGADLPERAVYILGNETTGISADVVPLVTRWLRIPLFAGVESLNVACAASLVAFEIARRRIPRVTSGTG